MTILEINEETLQIDSVRFDEKQMHVILKDGRTVSMPLWWSPRLFEASPEEREKWSIMPFGDAIEWDEIDEHLSVKGILRGKPAPGAHPPGTKVLEHA